MDASRRQALAGAAALTLASALPRSLFALGSDDARLRTVRPGRLRPGDTVGLVDPASATWEPMNVEIVATQLRLAGILQKARAVIWGNCTDCRPGEGFGSLTVTEVLQDHLRPLGVPAWSGAMIGHVDRQFTLPVGIEVEVDATAGTIRMLQPAVLDPVQT